MYQPTPTENTTRRARTTARALGGEALRGLVLAFTTVTKSHLDALARLRPGEPGGARRQGGTETATPPTSAAVGGACCTLRFRMAVRQLAGGRGHRWRGRWPPWLRCPAMPV